MEQRKSDINTGDGNVVNIDTNGLSYSFDFSNQVQNNSQVAPVAPVQPEVAPTVPVQPEVTPAVAPVQPEVAPTVPVQPEVTPAVAPVQPEVAPTVPVQPEVTPAVAPVGSEINNVDTSTSTDSLDDDLINDKKSTKAFLIVLSLIIIGFIIFLDPIYNFVSSIIG